MVLSYFRTVLLYLVLIFSIRLMGKRQIGQLEASEFVVTMLVANLASIPMQDSAIPLLSGLVPILVVLGMELVMSCLILKNIRVRRLLCGKPVILIDNGKVLYENLKATRLSIDELTGHLRQKDVLDIQSVQYAILETNGELSVFPYPKDRPATAAEAGIPPRQQLLPVTIIEDGYLSREDLRRAGKDEAWLTQVCGQERKSVLLLTIDEEDNLVLLRKEKQ